MDKKGTEGDFESLIGSRPHHAYAILGEIKAIRAGLFNFLKNSWNVSTEANPDFFYQSFQNLSVYEARELKGLESNKTMREGKKIFVIEAESITIPAQNSLLKILEEPTKGTHFFFIGNCTRNLIPTLSSRLLKVSFERTNSKSHREAEIFLSALPPERLALVKKLTEDIKDEKKTKADAFELIEGIEKILYEKASLNGNLPEALFRNLEMCREYLGDASASVKMLFEYIALVIPSKK